jgi:hypothetical protein
MQDSGRRARDVMLEAWRAALSAWACAFIFMGANARMCCGAAQDFFRRAQDQGVLADDCSGDV